MDITWLGHSCFRIKGGQVTIITDPYPPGLGYTLGKAAANIVTVSHQHEGHSYVQGIGGEPRVINRPGEYEIGGAMIIGIPTFHDQERGGKLGKNIIYVMEVDGITVCHLGDLGHTLTAQQVEDIDNVDVLLLPVGGQSTINATMAAEVVRQLEPKAVVPMHYKTPAITWQLDPVDRFFKEMGAAPPVPRPKLTLNRSTLPAVSQVVLLSYPNET